MGRIVFMGACMSWKCHWCILLFVTTKIKDPFIIEEINYITFKLNCQTFQGQTEIYKTICIVFGAWSKEQVSDMVN